MSDENRLWETLRERLTPYGLMKRVENAAIDEGCPDVTYLLRVPARPVAVGWLELKHLAAWPVQDRWKVVVPHLTREQVLWLQSWCSSGGRADLLLQVARDYLLLDASATMALWRRELDHGQLVDRARVVGCGRFPARDLVRWLTRPG